MRRAAAVAVMGAVVFVAHAAAPAANGGQALLKNPGIDKLRGDLPADWYPCFIPGRGAKFRLDTKHFHSKPGSLSIEAVPAEGEPVSNNWAQRIEKPPAGKTVRLISGLRCAASRSGHSPGV